MRQAAAQQHNDDDDARDPPHHEPETLAPVAPGRDLGHVRTRRQAAFTPTINVLYQPQREPSAAPPSRDPWRTEIEGGASPGGADFSDVEQGRVSGRSLFILSHSLHSRSAVAASLRPALDQWPIERVPVQSYSIVLVTC